LIDTTATSPEFGVMTMAESPAAIERACGLALSLDATGERVPRVILHPRDLPVPAGYFDMTIRMPADPYRGRWFYLNKLVHPYALSPFDRTLFIDSDVIVRRPIRNLVTRHFVGKPIALCVKHEPLDSTQTLGNHFTPKLFVEQFGTPLVQNPDGGGHMYFESGATTESIVARALELVTCNEDLYHRISGNFGFVADELALLAILTIDGIVLPAGLGAVHPVQPHDVDATVADLLTGTVQTQAALFHFFGQGKESESYSRLLASIPARWRG
jgi:hypothetical protein